MKIREHHNHAATAGSPSELLAAVPHLLGFHPQSSIVVVHVDLERRRTGTLLRLDLPAAGDEEGYAAQLARLIERGRPDGVLLVCYGYSGAPPVGPAPSVGPAPPAGLPPSVGAAPPTGLPPSVGSTPPAGLPPSVGSTPPPGYPPDGTSNGPPGAVRDALPYRALIDRIVGELAHGPVAVLGAAYVDGGRWWAYDCDHASCRPADGVPLPDPSVGAAADVMARAALAGRRTLASRRELEDAVRGPTGAAEKAMLGVVERVDRELAAEALADGAEMVRRRTLALARSELARFADGHSDPSDDDVARLSLGAADVLVRDRLIAFHGADPAAWLGLLTALARRTPDARAAAICGVVAWVGYQQGDGALANVALDRVLSIDPGQTMALLLRDCLDAQVSPGHIRALTRDAVGAAEEARKKVSAAGAA